MVGERVAVSLNQNQGHLYTYFLFLGWGESRGADLNLAFDFLLPIAFSQFEKKKKNPGPAHMGSEGVGTFGSVAHAGEVSRLLRRVEGVGINEKGTLLVFSGCFFFFFNLTSSSQSPEGGAQRREGCRILEKRLSCGLEHLLLLTPGLSGWDVSLQTRDYKPFFFSRGGGDQFLALPGSPPSWGVPLPPFSSAISVPLSI